MYRFVRSLAVALLAFSGVVLVAPSAHAAAPRYIVAHGSLLQQPVVLDDWWENYFIVAVNPRASTPPMPVRADLSTRPYVSLAYYWNSHIWEPLVQQQGVGALRPDEANQSARFYPAFGDAPAVYVGVVDGREDTYLMSADGLAVFARRGIPTYIDPPAIP